MIRPCVSVSLSPQLPSLLLNRLRNRGTMTAGMEVMHGLSYDFHSLGLTDFSHCWVPALPTDHPESPVPGGTISCGIRHAFSGKLIKIRLFLHGREVTLLSLFVKLCQKYCLWSYIMRFPWSQCHSALLLIRKLILSQSVGIFCCLWNSLVLSRTSSPWSSWPNKTDE